MKVWGILGSAGVASRRWSLLLALALMTLATPTAALRAVSPLPMSSEPGLLSEPAFVVPATTPSSVVTLVNTFQLSPRIIDPSGIAYISALDRLLVSDSEIDEEPSLFTGDNLFELSRVGVLGNVGTSPDGPRLEPSGLGYNPANGHVFLTSDDDDRLFEIAPGADGIYGSADDATTSFSTASFGALDAEDVAFDSAEGTLFVADGTSRKLYRIFPGPNGTFDGPAPDGDDTVTSFDVSAWGIMNLEGLGYRSSSDTLLITDASPNDAIYEVTKDGFVLRYLSLNFLDNLPGVVTAADVAIAPASNGSGQLNMYVVDRVADNGDPADALPPPQDGRMFELSSPFPNLAPFVDAGIDRTVGLTLGATLDGMVAHDGLPAPGSISSAWSVVSGPGVVSFATPTAVDSKATFSQPGTYVLRLSATDSVLSTADTVQVVVLPDVPCVPGEPTQANFIDLSGLSTDALRAIDCLVRAKITLGTGPDTFSPYVGVSRWQMALFLIRTASAMGITLPDGASQGFADLGSLDSATQTAINQLAQLGITTGTGPGTFSPQTPVSRWQMAIFLTRLIALEGTALPSGEPVGFVDLGSLDSSAQTAINQLFRLGITKGTTATTYGPFGEVARWQMAIFLTRTLELAGAL